jgi:RNA polymerase sigma factor (sigma-70 family)
LCEDVAQQSFLRLARLDQMPTFPKGESQFRAYLQTLMNHIAIDTVKSHLRRRSREALSPHNHVTMTDERSLQLKELIDRLPPDERLPLDLAREGYTLQEVATLLGTSVSSAGRQRAALLERLQEQLESRPKNQAGE